MTDRELLASYAASGSQAAFAEMVERYGGMVYAVCLRALGDAHAAEDATQAVFLVLVRKARGLPGSTLLPGWLHRTAGLVARDAGKLAERRARHEKEAAAMRRAATPARGTPGLPAEARAHLDAALAALAEPQRSAIILRFLHGKAEPEIGRELGCGQSTVAMRISRGLEKLRDLLSRQGVAVPAAALGGLLAAEAQSAAPAALLATLKGIGAGAAAASVSATALAEGTMKAMMIAKIKLAAAVFAAVTVVGAGGSRTQEGRAQGAVGRLAQRAGAAPREDQGARRQSVAEPGLARRRPQVGQEARSGVDSAHDLHPGFESGLADGRRGA